MRFGKITMFFILNGIIALILCFHLGRWLFSSTTTGTIIRPYNATTINVRYSVNGETYTETFMRNDVSLFKQTVTVRYLNKNPSIARIDSFMGIYAEPLAWWLVFLIATSAFFFTNNVIFSKGTVFQLHRRFPWISMEEYFPLPKRWRRYAKTSNEKERKEDNRSGQLPG